MAHLHTLGQLGGHLLYAVDIAHSAQGCGPAHGYGIAFVALGRQLPTEAVHLPVDVLIVVGIHQAHLGAVDVIQHQVAPMGRNAPLFQQQDGLHPQPGGTGGGEHGVVGLGAAGGEHRVAALRAGLGKQILQLADLVAPQGYAAQVVPLDPDVPAVLGADTLQFIKRSGVDAQGDPGQRGICHKSTS